MGLIFSRQNARIEELDASSNNAYRYPNKDGNYFANHFIMGGERFETCQPEAYLFGENVDLNFLGGKPIPFPYPAPQPNEPTRTLKSLINIRKESLRFVKIFDSSETERSKTANNLPLSNLYNIEFIFDSDVSCGITIYYFCTEDITSNRVIYTPRDASMNSETFHYKKGVNQHFNQVSHVFDPSKFSDDMLNYKFEDEIIPVLIQCVAEEGEEPKQQHMVFAIVEKNLVETYTLKPLKQKLFVDGLCYLLQEIYGIENKNCYQSKDVIHEDVEDSGSECVICMSDARDTLILPCRHLCLCNSCADSLRYQANNCPICRAPFRALLQIRAVRKSNNLLPQINHNVDNQPSQDLPSGYEPVSLIETLNGPFQSSAPLVPAHVPTSIPSFGNSPDIRHKHNHIHRKHSSSTSRLCDSNNSTKDEIPQHKTLGCSDSSSFPEVVETMLSSDNMSLKIDSLSLTRGEEKRHCKGYKTSSAPEKIRLLAANSIEIVNEVGSAKKIMENKSELTETKLESNLINKDKTVAAVSSPKPSRPCSRSSPLSSSTPHSLHLCEKSSKDTSPGGEDSDYYTPEDPNTTLLVDQGTDTSLDTPQGIEAYKISESIKLKAEQCLHEKHKTNKDKLNYAEDFVQITNFNLQTEEKTPTNTTKISHSVLLSNVHSPILKLDNTISLPGTPASNTSNHSSGDSFSSISSTHVLLQPYSYDTLHE